jgi:predicted DNA binding CopG/RHH family protein
MAKRQTIGDNPLDGLFQTEKNETENKEALKAVAVLDQEESPTQIKVRAAKKQRITVQISEEVIERIKNAVYWTPGLTLAALAEEAFSRAVDELEEENKAQFPKRKEELKTGRPIN